MNTVHGLLDYRHLRYGIVIAGFFLAIISAVLGLMHRETLTLRAEIAAVQVSLKAAASVRAPDAWCPPAIDGRVRVRANYSSPYRSQDAGVLSCWYYLPRKDDKR